MNILVITAMYSQPDDSGDNKPTKTVNYFAKEWAKAGNRVIVIHCSSKFPLLFYFVPKFLTDIIAKKTSNIIPSLKSRKTLHYDDYGVKVFRMPMFKLYPGQGYSKNTIKRQTQKITKALERMGFVPDLITGHFANPSLAIVCDLAKKYKAKSSIVFHHDCTYKNLIKYDMTKNIKCVGAIGARSLTEAKQIKDLLNLSFQPFLCYSGVPNEAIETAEKRCTKHDFANGIKHIYVGSFIPRKHLDSTIRAFSKKYHNPKDRAELTVVGGGVEEKKIRSLVFEMNMTDKIKLVGRLPRDEVLKKMKEANIFTLISEDEVYGMVYVEAMLQGCLTIASKNGGFDGIIVDGVNGFICNPGDEDMLESIYDKIEKMTAEKRNQIGQKAIETALKFSEKEVAENYLQSVLKQNV